LTPPSRPPNIIRTPAHEPPQDGPMLVANTWSHPPGKRHALWATPAAARRNPSRRSVALPLNSALVVDGRREPLTGVGGTLASQPPAADQPTGLHDDLGTMGFCLGPGGCSPTRSRMWDSAARIRATGPGSRTTPPAGRPLPLRQLGAHSRLDVDCPLTGLYQQLGLTCRAEPELERSSQASPECEPVHVGRARAGACADHAPGWAAAPMRQSGRPSRPRCNR
jgi:hypothetical protein